MSLLQKNKIFLLLLLLLSLPAVFSLFHRGFFLSDDGNWMVIRFSAFYEALRSGQFPVRFLPRLNYEYGYPVADFLYPLFMYIGVPVHIIGINFVTTIKIIFGASLIGSGIATFFWLRKLTTQLGAFVGSLIFLYFPYHLFDIYQRGSIGEMLALAIVPLILWQAERKKLIYTAVFFTLLILSHNSLAVLFLPFIILYLLIRKLFTLKQLIGLIAVVFGLSAFFWIPALYDKQFTNFDITTVSNLQTYFVTSSTYYLFGWITVVILVSSAVLLFVRRSYLSIYFFCISIFSLFMSLPISNSIWQMSHIGPYFQFPYRFLSLAILSISFLGAICITVVPKKIQLIGFGLLLIILFLSSWNLILPKGYQYYPDSYYSTNQNSTTVKNEYMPKWVKVLPLQGPKEKAYLQDKNGSVQMLQERGTKLVLQTISMNDTVLYVTFVDFPGWKAIVDGKQAVISHENKQGLIEFNVPKGTHVVTIVFTETPVRLFADILSLITLATIIIVLIKKKHE